MKLEEYGRMFETEETQWWYVGMRAISRALLEPAINRATTPFALLDAGCGTGNNLLHLRRSGPAVGVDLSLEALRFCRTRGVAAARADLAALPFKAAAFDCVTSFDVLYHRWIRDDQAAVRELARVLKPGGLCLVRVPALMALWGAHDEAVQSRHRYTRREVVSLLEGAGLQVLRATYCNTVLLPLLFVRRTLDRMTGRQGSDVGFLWGPLEWAFRHALEAEAWWLRSGSLPLGASVCVLGRKPEDATGTAK